MRQRWVSITVPFWSGCSYGCFLKKDSPGALFHMASSFAPIPAKLVKRIQNLEYVDLRELLPDNIALSEKRHALTTPATQSVTPEQREITKLVTWVSCFSTYVAIAAQKHPERTRDMMAYMRLMVREGYKHGGMGWLKYDCIFRKNNPGPSASWDVLDPSLLTIVAHQGYSPRPPSHHCQELDHSPTECALAPLAQPTRLPWQGRPTGYPRKGKRPAPYETAPSSGRYTPHDPPANFPSTSDGGPPRPRIWNKGQCAFQGACTYAHICPTCNSGSHRARDCPRTPFGYCCGVVCARLVDIMGDVVSTRSSADAGSMGGAPDDGGRRLIALMAWGTPGKE